MQTTVPSFRAIRDAITSLWPSDQTDLEFDSADQFLLFRSHADVAAFTVLNGEPERDFPEAYGAFKALYRRNSRDWDQRTLSFVVCRSSENAEHDQFFAALETDPLFCRKYVIRARDTIDEQRDELLRLPFLPLPTEQGGIQRPRPAQDLLLKSGIPSLLARNLIESGRRSPRGIVADLLAEGFPAVFEKGEANGGLLITGPQAASRMTSLKVEAFRAYRQSQTLDLDGSVVVLYGPNGLGKTSVFDAIDFACTGRIGRLCRSQRSQSDFARIATHLDKTPGSGSVELTVRGPSSDSPLRLIQRSTGDWSKAWLDGKEADRKTVLNWLTQARWIDSTPRQQTLESLFRATHLFGQDEQELLPEFRKGSVIPEHFVSEMLSLQDYSEGLKKTAGVLDELHQQEATAVAEFEALRLEADKLAESISRDLSSVDTLASAPMDTALAALTDAADRFDSRLPSLPSTTTEDALLAWHEMAQSLREIQSERVIACETLLDELGGHHRQLSLQRARKQRLGEIDEDLLALQTAQADLVTPHDSNERELIEAEARAAELREQRELLQSAADALTQQEKLVKRQSTLAERVAEQAKESAAVDSRLVKREEDLAAAMRTVSDAEQSVASAEAEAQTIRSLIEGITSFFADQTYVAATAAQLVAAQEGLRATQGLREQLAAQLRSVQESLAKRAEEFEKARSSGAELDELLDHIQQHVRGESCPLCGSAFESRSALLDRIRDQRELSARASQIFDRQQELLEEAARLTTELAAADEHLAESAVEAERLTLAIESARARLRQFRTQIASVLGETSEPLDWAPALNERIVAVLGWRTENEKILQDASQQLASLRGARATDTSARDALRAILDESEREQQELAREASALAVTIARASSNATGNRPLEVHMREELVRLDTDARATLERIGELTDRRKQLERTAAEVATKAHALSVEREAVVEELSDVNRSVDAFRQRLKGVGLGGEATSEILRQEIHGASEAREALDQILEKAQLVLGATRAREIRLQVDERRGALDQQRTFIESREERLRQLLETLEGVRRIERLLKGERARAVEAHIGAYGPMITMIQQRLRSVHGFGGVELETSGTDARVRVSWERKDVQVVPTDFFSDSQKQILMLSIFMAGSLRQNWSGFAPVLLDDPVTHFDDLNGYAFVELIRGIIGSSPDRWQFVISTCEHRLFELMRRKFARLPSGAVFYEFTGITESGPIVERR
jgi:exonuclease SbcC